MHQQQLFKCRHKSSSINLPIMMAEYNGKYSRAPKQTKLGTNDLFRTIKKPRSETNTIYFFRFIFCFILKQSMNDHYLPPGVQS